MKKPFFGMALISLYVSAFGAAFAQQNKPQYVNADARWQWPASSDGITNIPVCWENPEGFTTETGWVSEAIANTWVRVANVNFHGFGKCGSTSRGVRILIADTRSRSYIGRALDAKYGGMELNFEFRNFMPSCQAGNKREHCIKAIAVHEFGHALGLAHEQDRGDSTCDEEPRRGNGGWRVTAYDPESVMNYCNPRWNNGGELSALDIKGIQEIYGARAVARRKDDVYGQILIENSLGNGQFSENVVLDLYNSAGVARQFFSINRQTQVQTRSWTFSDTGTYCYRVWSYTHYQDYPREGYGQGCFTLQKGEKYSLKLYQNRWNPQGYFDLIVKN